MTEFLAAILAYPTVLFTTLLGVVSLYWAFVVLGFLEADALDPGALDGAAHGALDGAAHGALDGAGHAAAEGVAHDGLADGGDAHGHPLATALGALGLAGIPVMLTASVFAAYGWAASTTVVELIGQPFTGSAPRLAAGAGLALATAVAALTATALTLRPFRKLFVVRRAAESRSFIGRTCTVRSMRLEDGYGQAELEDGGAGLLISVRAGQGHHLRRGEEAIVFDYDPQEGVFHVAPAHLGDPGSEVAPRPR